MQIFQQIIARWLAPMPQFFKVIFWVASTITALSIAANTLAEQLAAAGIAPPDWLTQIAGWAAATAAIVAKLTVDWNDKRAAGRLNAIG